MPKQFKTYTRFDGGLNTKTNSRSILDNELAQANNVIVDEFGIVKSCGKTAANTGSGKDYQAPAVTAVQAGYGLFQTKFDRNKSNSDTSVISTFYANADDGSKVTVERSDGQGNAFTDDTIDLGAVTSNEQGKVIMHIADGIIRACDTNINNTSTSVKKYGYYQITARFKDSSGNGQSPGGYDGSAFTGFQDLDTKLSSPTRGVCGKAMIGVVNSGGDTNFASTTSGAFPDSTTSEFSSGVYVAVNEDTADNVDSSDASTDVISSRTNTTTLATAGSGASFSSTEVYAIYPPGGTGFNLHFSTTSSDGSWEAGDYEFATTFIYDGNQESLPFQLGGELTVAANDSITCTVLGTQNLSSGIYSGNIKGGRIYFRDKDSDGAFILFGEISLIEGAKPTIDGEFTFWELEYTSAPFIKSSFVSTFINVDTYESLNGYSQDSPFISIGNAGEKYQTSVVTNRRAFIANVKYTNAEGVLQNNGDQIRYSEINRFDTFPEFNFLDIGVNDGEDFIKLEAFADRLLAYKQKTLYVINIGGGSDTQWFLESTQNNMGVDFHGAVTKTELGVCWVNKNGLYIYDGSKITNLQTKIIESDWTGFVNDDTMIGYEPTHKHLVIVRDAAASGDTSGDAYIYSFITNSFVFVEDLFADAVKTNIITDLYNNMSAGSGTTSIVSYDGEPDYHTTFDIKLKDDDFGLPNTVKKIYGVTIEYSSNAKASDDTQVNHSNGFKYFYTNSNGDKQPVANGGDIVGTTGDLDVNRINFSPPLTVSSFQVQIDLDAADDETANINKINNIGVEYRPLYKRIT